MAGHQSGQGFIDPKLTLLNHTGSWEQDQQESRDYTKVGTFSRLPFAAVADIQQKSHTGGTDDGQGAFGEVEPQSSIYPLTPLLSEEHAPHSKGSDDFDNLDEVARRVNQGQTTAAHIAHVSSEPFNNLLDRYSPILLLGTGDGRSSVDLPIDPLLDADPRSDPFTKCHSDEAVAKPCVGDSIYSRNVAQIPGVPEHAAHSHRVRANSTLDCTFEEMMTLGLSRQPAAGNMGLGVPLDAVNSGDLRPDLRRSVHQVGHRGAPQTSTPNATLLHTDALHASTRLAATSAPQRDPLNQPDFTHGKFGRVYIHTAHSANFVDHQEPFDDHDESAGAGLDHYEVDQAFGPQFQNEDFTAHGAHSFDRDTQDLAASSFHHQPLQMYDQNISSSFDQYLSPG